jgi:hypothetical protein
MKKINQLLTALWKYSFFTKKSELFMGTKKRYDHV